MNRLLSARSYYRFLGNGDPTAGVPVKHDKLQPRQPFTDGELRRMLEACRNARDTALLTLLIGSGCRRGEIVSLRAESIDWARGRILVFGKGSKERWIAPGPTALGALGRYLDGRREGRIFAIDGSRLYKIVRRIASRAGVVRAHPHRLRVHFAVSFLDEYGDIAALKELLGHDDLKTTEHYGAYHAATRALRLQQSLDLSRLALA